MTANVILVIVDTHECTQAGVVYLSGLLAGGLGRVHFSCDPASAAPLLEAIERGEHVLGEVDVAQLTSEVPHTDAETAGELAVGG